MMPCAACENSKAKTNSVWGSAWINVGRLPSSCRNLNATDIATVFSFLWVSNIHISSFPLLKHHLWAFFKVILPWCLADELAMLLPLLRELSGHKIRFSNEEEFSFLFKCPFIYWEKEVMFLLKCMWKQRLYPINGLHTAVSCSGMSELADLS